MLRLFHSTGIPKDVNKKVEIDFLLQEEKTLKL